MSFVLDEAFEILNKTPATLEALLRGSAASWHRATEGPDTWSAFEVIGHLIHADETDWIPRARIILEHGDRRAFDPFDRFAQVDRFKDWSLDDLLDRFAEVRRGSLDLVHSWNLTDEQLSLRGRHPELGGVTLRELLATWVAHDLDHIGQIVRVMAKRYGEAVGPWSPYLSILNR